MTIRLSFEIQMESDYHVGAGQRAGLTVDSALLRDYDQAPILRGTILAGLLRDGLLDLQELMKANAIPVYQNLDQAMIRLFGSAEQRKLWAYSSARPAKGDFDSNRWGAQDIARVRVNPITRRVAPQHLFIQEEGDARLRFHFTATCHMTNGQSQDDAVLLAAAARMVRHLGAARRRGRGVCTLRLVGATNFILLEEEQTWQERVLEEFKKRWLTAGYEPAEITSDVGIEEPVAITGQKQRYRIIARTVEPVIISYRSEAANAFETRQVIPGTALLGALANRAAQRMGLGSEAQAPAEFAQLFLRGHVAIANLLPAIEAGFHLYPTIPAPKSLSQCENYPGYIADDVDPQAVKKHPVYNFLHEMAPDACTAQHGEIECGGKLQEVSAFLKLDAGKRVRHEPGERKELHIRMQRESGRAREGDLYEYVALEAGQWFVGELQCDKKSWSRLQALTGLDSNAALSLRLGKATQRGYGLVDLVLEELKDDAVSSFILSPIVRRVPAGSIQNNSVEVSLLLLTDTIVVDTWNRFYPGFHADWLTKAFGRIGINKQPVVEKVELVDGKQFSSSRRVDAFNAHRRMPRWRDEAIEAGSIALLRLNLADGIDAQTLHECLFQMEQNGLGLRRHEGYGRIAFNHPVLDKSPKFTGPIDLADALDVFPGGVESHALQGEAQFRKAWTEALAQETWDAIHSAYEPLAQLLFVFRYRPIEEIEQWLRFDKEGNPETLGRASHLWGNKELVSRDKEGKIDQRGLELIQRLVTELKGKSKKWWPLGLAMLAERISDIARGRAGG